MHMIPVVRTTGVRTGDHESRAAAVRAYMAEHPDAKADEIAQALGCTRHQVWSVQANDRRMKELAAKTNDRRKWMHGFAAALASFCRLGRAGIIREVMYAHGVAYPDLAAAEVADDDLHVIHAALE